MVVQNKDNVANRLSFFGFFAKPLPQLFFQEQSRFLLIWNHFFDKKLKYFYSFSTFKKFWGEKKTQNRKVQRK